MRELTASLEKRTEKKALDRGRQCEGSRQHTGSRTQGTIRSMRFEDLDLDQQRDSGTQRTNRSFICTDLDEQII